MGTLLEISNYLQLAGIGTVGGSGQWAIYRERIPASSHDDAIGIYSTGGMNSEKTFSGSPGTAPFTYPRFQVMVRSMDADAADAKALAIWKALDGLGNITIGGTQWHFIEALGEPNSIGPDENDRIRIVCNYQANKRVSAA